MWTAITMTAGWMKLIPSISAGGQKFRQMESKTMADWFTLPRPMATQ